MNMTKKAVTISEKEEKKKKRVAWGITGGGEQLAETIETMKKIKKQYENKVDIIVYLSKAGDQVLKYYKLANTLKETFSKIWVEINANAPFLAGQLQTGKFEFLLIAPATSNTVAKISMGITDSLLTNAAIMALKVFTPLYVMPTDYKEGTTTTKLPDGQDIRIRVREEDVENVKKLASMQDVFIFEKPMDINQIFKKHFGSEAYGCSKDLYNRTNA
jgi:archaeoflavoprotein AfpA